MCMVVRVSGTQLLSILENGVSMYPKHEGRFPQVSGVRFIYDPALPPRSRVVKVWVGTTPANERLLDLSAHYTIATRGYMVSGKDGYDDLAKAEVVREEENGHLMSTLFRRFFMKLKVINAFKHSGHFVSMAQEIFRANRAGSGAALASLVTEKSTEKDHEKSEKSHEKGGEDSLARSSSTSSTHSISASTRWHKLGEAVHPSFLKLEPIVHGRILTVSEAKAQGVKF